MAHTLTSKRRFPKIKGGFRHGIVDITFVDNYPAGGFTFGATDLKLDRVYFFIPPACVRGATETYVTQVTYTSDTAFRVKMLVIADGGESQEGGDLSGVTIRCRYWGE